MNWSVIPDIVAAGFLAIAFASVLNRNGVSEPVLWLIGWLRIVLHFIVLLFFTQGGIWDNLSNITATVTLIWAALFSCGSQFLIKASDQANFFSPAFYLQI